MAHQCYYEDRIEVEYDYEIENVAEYKDPDEIIENQVFDVLDKIQITKDNAKVLALTRNKK